MGGDDHMRVRGRVRNYGTSPAKLFRSGADGPVARAHPLQRPSAIGVRDEACRSDGAC
jgi:hypothetical protein